MIEQLAIYLENRCGRVSDCCHVFKENDINLKYLSIADTTDFGILRVITSVNEKAKQVLKQAGFVTTSVQLIAVKVNDTPGELSSILNLFAENDIDVSYLYSYKDSANADIIAFKTNNEIKALELLNGKNKEIL